jgi:hypothetical protein
LDAKWVDSKADKTDVEMAGMLVAPWAEWMVDSSVEQLVLLQVAR